MYFQYIKSGEAWTNAAEQRPNEYPLFLTKHFRVPKNIRHREDQKQVQTMFIPAVSNILQLVNACPKQEALPTTWLPLHYCLSAPAFAHVIAFYKSENQDFW